MGFLEWANSCSSTCRRDVRKRRAPSSVYADIRRRSSREPIQSIIRRSGATISPTKAGQSISIRSPSAKTIISSPPSPIETRFGDSISSTVSTICIFLRKTRISRVSNLSRGAKPTVPRSSKIASIFRATTRQSIAPTSTLAKALKTCRAEP